ncbi:hypothetical protein MJO29_005924 [Puccinia striiformis f. sp. tritici]|nr:hypothetical protein Pst134EA_011112 [Puccinia striiformis f. sp. tritici]KAH9455894.1 hypothetical protein Pst134EB_012123 [Puccinia striiformis f. sp. tritici]KAH9467469.1 hypothetical protein Pst134EA_011112 [Puccinia striiformis f. sp. tritici]KAI7957707.1 hypothetical protein MJO29_005924 [Puccinia striiformis f. sp. tritici]KAI9604744.1 hypothetical protein H4Q26_002713 [Puccinia striiformis f. sp. tritici PST-130]
MSSTTHTLRNPLANPNEPTPSSIDGVSTELERELRLYGALLIQQAGVLLKLPQIVMATASTLFQRFYFVTSFIHFGIRDISSGALFLASKLEEKPTRIRDIINVYDYLISLIDWSRDQVSMTSRKEEDSSTAKRMILETQQKIKDNPLLPAEIKLSMIRNLESKHPSSLVVTQDSSSCHRLDQSKFSSLDISHFKYTPMDYFHQKFYDRKEEIVVSEMQILKRLGFHVQVQQPYSAMVNYLQVLNLTDNEDITQRAWNVLNDSLLTSLPALYPASHLGALSIYVSIRDQSIVRLPDEWWTLFDVSEENELIEMAAILESIYPSSTSSDDYPSVWVRVSGLPITKEALRRSLLM